MSLTTVCVTPSPISQLLVLACFFWPFIAASLLTERGRSAGPISAVLVPLCLSSAGLWLGLARTMEGRAISGGGEHAAAAGIAEALFMLFIGGCSAVGVIFFAAIRRHRPFVDRTTAVLFAILIVDDVAAFIAAANLANLQIAVFVAGAVVGGVIALIAMAWTFLTGRGRVPSQPLPHGVIVLATLIVTIGVIAHELMQWYRAVAMGAR